MSINWANVSGEQFETASLSVTAFSVCLGEEAFADNTAASKKVP